MQIKIIKLSDIKNNNFILSPRYYLNKKKARKNGKNKTKPRVQKQDRKSYASTLGTREHARERGISKSEGRNETFARFDLETC